jgi:hypothetical protein
LGTAQTQGQVGLAAYDVDEFEYIVKYPVIPAVVSVEGDFIVDGSIFLNGETLTNVDLTNVSTSIIPTTDNVYDLGSEDKRFRHLYVGPGSIYIGNSVITETPTAIDLPAGTTIGGEEPLKTTIQNIFNEIITNYLVYNDIAGAPIAITDVDQLSDLTNKLVTVSITDITYPDNDSSTSTEGNEIIELTGTGFQRACNVYINGVAATSTSYINSTSIRFVTTAQAAGMYTITVVNPDSTTAVLSPGILYTLPGNPRFTNISGLLVSSSRNTAMSITLSVADGVSPYTFSILSGSLPSGLSLDSATGVISGTTPDVDYDTVFNFVAQVTDSTDPALTSTGSFYILVTIPVPTELTIGGSALISNRAFFIEYEEDITNAPTFTITGTSVISNNTFFVEYEEDITNSPTFTITGTAVTSYTPV